MDSEDQEIEEQHEVVNSVNFNSDSSCLALATTRGFKVFSTQPLLIKQHRDLSTPLQFVEMVDRTNILLFVGFENTAFSANSLALFDDNLNQIVADLTFAKNILGVRARMKKILVGLCDKVYLIDLLTLETELILPTIRVSEIQHYDLLSMSINIDNFLVAVASYDKGNVTLVSVTRNKQRKIKAHRSALTSILLSPDAQKLATASETGMNIRVFSTQTGALLQQVRRGNEFGFVYSLSFSRSGNWLACTSDSCNIHIFTILPLPGSSPNDESTAETVRANPKSYFYFLRKLLPFFDAEYSYCQYIIADFEPEMQHYLTFGFHDDSLMVVNDYGNLKKIEINPKGGKCREIQSSVELLEMTLLA